MFMMKRAGNCFLPSNHKPASKIKRVKPTQWLTHSPLTPVSDLRVPATVRTSAPPHFISSGRLHRVPVRR